MKILHIINPVKVGETSDLFIAQPITFESMRRAKLYAETIDSDISVQLFSTQYPEDYEIIPNFINTTSDLERSVLDVGDFKIPRKLPLISDILLRGFNAVEADYIIYTNTDIGLMPSFYLSVKALIKKGYSSLVINRRTISDKYIGINDLPLICQEIGKEHPGYDCFVFKKDSKILELINRENLTCIGINYVGLLLLLQVVTTENYLIYKNSHLTFHIGDDKIWNNNKYIDYRNHNRNQVIKEYLFLLNQNERLKLNNDFLDIGNKLGLGTKERKVKQSNKIFNKVKWVFTTIKRR